MGIICFFPNVFSCLTRLTKIQDGAFKARLRTA